MIRQAGGSVRGAPVIEPVRHGARTEFPRHVPAEADEPAAASSAMIPEDSPAFGLLIILNMRAHLHG